MTTAVKAKAVRKNLHSSANIESPTEPTKTHNRDVAGGRGCQNVVSDSSARLSPNSRTNVENTESYFTSASAEHAWKRVLDLSCILLSLPVILPVMLLIVLWVRLVSSGPALFRQERVGQDGKRFVLYKFRSMKLDASNSRHEKYLRHLVASNSPMVKLDLLCDSRLIPGGCLLRAAGLDELPQLLNVLRGEMSLVGPRPCLPSEYDYFSNQQRERFSALPGLTGSWQVNGKNRSTFNEMNLLDIDYIRNASPLLDLKIMVRTPGTLLLQMSQAFKQRVVVKHQKWIAKVRV